MTMTPRGLLLVTLSLISADSSYVPGTPGAPWTRATGAASAAAATVANWRAQCAPFYGGAVGACRELMRRFAAACAGLDELEAQRCLQKGAQLSVRTASGRSFVPYLLN